MNTEPHIAVGILSTPRLSFELKGRFQLGGEWVSGLQVATLKEGLIEWGGRTSKELLFTPDHDDAFFCLHEVVIGIGFHWERKEDQCFKGSLRLIIDADRIVAINLIAAEAYLSSVISSEMSAHASLSLLQAHAVISRSWLLKPLLDQNKAPQELPATSPDRIIRWYERDAHALFDVCADDHCQRYQGITRAVGERVQQAMKSTRGEVLMHHGSVCDARYYKACGGATETFDSCWAEEDHPYLKSIYDSESAACTDPDMNDEAKARAWILSEPEAFCNTRDAEVLRQVLNDYDQETTRFFRWEQEYTQDELSALVNRKSGIDFGTILDLIPLKRGRSGRIVELRIVGTKHTVVVGKELEIRKWLSESHLYSSAFVVDTTTNEHETRFVLRGAGWGHGVGLCQIGAAVMGAQNYTYQQILKHYFNHATVEQIY